MEEPLIKERLLGIIGGYLTQNVPAGTSCVLGPPPANVVFVGIDVVFVIVFTSVPIDCRKVSKML